MKELKFCLLHITILLLFSSILQAQTDSAQFQILDKLSADLFILSKSQEIGTFTHLFATEQIPDSISFETKYHSLNPVLFRSPLSGAAVYYSFLSNLKPEEKESLVMRYVELESRFQDQFDAASLPKEISFLAPALSGLNLSSISQEQRAGLWQLTHFQAVLNGLNISRLVDERFDAGKSTTAAVSEMSKMKKVFGSEEKAILAFLTGSTNLKNAMNELPENAGTEETLSLLAPSVSETLALWQAMHVFLTENKSTTNPQFIGLDTIQVDRQIHFKQLEKVIGVSLATLQELNPKYPYSIAPGTREANDIYLPKGKKAEFLLRMDSVYESGDSTWFEVLAHKIEYPPAPTRQFVGEKVKDLEIEGKTKIKYTLKSGDVLGFIAEDYNVEVEDLKYWNNISNERRIQAGQKLDIFVDDEDADYFRQLHPEPLTKSGKTNPAAAASFPIPENARKIEHEVKSGESPFVIAKKYKGVTPEAILYWNGISDARKIQIGQKLIIYVSQ